MLGGVSKASGGLLSPGNGMGCRVHGGGWEGIGQGLKGVLEGVLPFGRVRGKEGEQALEGSVAEARRGVWGCGGSRGWKRGLGREGPWERGVWRGGSGEGRGLRGQGWLGDWHVR